MSTSDVFWRFDLISTTYANLYVNEYGEARSGNWGRTEHSVALTKGRVVGRSASNKSCMVVADTMYQAIDLAAFRRWCEGDLTNNVDMSVWQFMTTLSEEPGTRVFHGSRTSRWKPSLAKAKESFVARLFARHRLVSREHRNVHTALAGLGYLGYLEQPKKSLLSQSFECWG